MQTQTLPHIAFDDVGDESPALLFLPGWCANRTVFRPLLNRAAKHHRAVALDWRGHGASDRPDVDFGDAELVDDAIGVIERAGLDQVVPVALAHSGWVAIELRRRLGHERIPGLVLLDWMVLGPPPGFLDAVAALQQEDSWRAVRDGLLAMWLTDPDNAGLREHVESMAAYGYEDWSRAAREIGGQFAELGTPLAALERLDPPCPTVHLYSQPPDEELLAAQQAYAGQHPWFHVERLAATSHFPMFEVPDQMVTSIDAFVDALPVNGA